MNKYYYSLESKITQMMQNIYPRPQLVNFPEVPLPFYIRSTGYYEVPKGWEENLPAARRPFIQFFWTTQGKGKVIFDDRQITMPAGTFFYHLPGEDHHHIALEGWCYYWVTLDGPRSVDFFSSYEYSRTTHKIGECPRELFSQIQELITQHSPWSQRKMVSIVTEILALAGQENTISPKQQIIIKLFIDLVQKEFSCTNTNIDTLTARMGIHRTTLNRIFKEKMLISPIDYLIRTRLQKALYLLRNTPRKICDIGEMVGIPHRGYFCSLIKKHTGTTPKEYRKNI